MSLSLRPVVCSLAVLFTLATAACRTGGGPTAKAPTSPETPPYVLALVGEHRILIGGSGGRPIARKVGEAAPKPGPCDAAVEVRQASLEGGTLRLVVAYLGDVRVEGAAPNRGKPCAVQPETSATVAGLGADAPAVEQEMNRVLPTPEAYLAAAGVSFDRPTEVLEGVAATGSGTSSAPERNLARQVTTWPKRLLWVDAAVPAPKKGLRREVEVEVRAVVGSDGRLTEPSVLTPLNEDHLKAVKRGLTIWRFVPARAGDKALAARVTSRLALRMY